MNKQEQTSYWGSEKLSDEKLFDSVIYTKGMTFEESAQIETDLKQTLEIQQQKLGHHILRKKMYWILQFTQIMGLLKAAFQCTQLALLKKLKK